MLGIDILPGSQPPVGVKAIQGDFLSPAVQVLVKRLVMEAASARDQDGNGENEKKRHMPVDVSAVYYPQSYRPEVREPRLTTLPPLVFRLS